MKEPDLFLADDIDRDGRADEWPSGNGIARDNSYRDIFSKCRDRIRVLFHPLNLTKTYQVEDMYRRQSTEDELHTGIQALMPQHDRTSDIANKLAVVIERLAARFASIKGIKWLHATDDFDGSLSKRKSFQWSISMVVQTLIGNRTAKVVRMNVTRLDFDSDDTWTKVPGMMQLWALDKRDHLRSVLCLWLYTLAERARAVNMVRKSSRKIPTTGAMNGLGTKHMYASWARGHLAITPTFKDIVMDCPNGLENIFTLVVQIRASSTVSMSMRLQ